MTIPRALAVATVIIFALRLGVIFALPLTGDEAYYWEWAMHPAFGYVDHPPAVAYTVMLFQWLGRSAGILRLGFWLCGIIATLATADTARRIVMQSTGDALQARRAALQAAFFVSIAPIASLAFMTVSPDGPYLAAWALFLDCAVALEGATGRFAGVGPYALGAALAAALCARAFAASLVLSLLVGIRPSPRILVRVLLTTAVLCAPFLAWNAQHHWETFVFTFAGRHVNEGFSPARVLTIGLEVLAAFGLFSTPVLLAYALKQRTKILAWAAFPLTIVFVASAFFERVETYWFLAPYLSLCVAAAVVASGSCGPGRTPRGLRASCAFSYGLTAFVLSILLAPFTIFTVLSHTVHLRLKNPSIFEIYTYAPLARDVRAFSAAHHATIMTDGYGLSSMLDYYAGVAPLVIGYSRQGREALRWVPSTVIFPHALFVDREALSERPDFARQLALACRHVYAGPVFAYALPGLPARRYPTTWCDGMRPGGIGILRWEV